MCIKCPLWGHTQIIHNYTHAIHTQSPLWGPPTGAPYGDFPLRGPPMGAPYGGVSSTGAFTFMGMSPQKILLEKNDFHSLKADHYLLYRDAHLEEVFLTNVCGTQNILFRLRFEHYNFYTFLYYVLLYHTFEDCTKGI